MAAGSGIPLAADSRLDPITIAGDDKHSYAGRRALRARLGSWPRKSLHPKENSMSATVASSATVSSSKNAVPALRRALIALYVGAAAAIALATILALVTTSSDDAKFHHIGDYFLTANGIPYVLALLALLPALRELQERRDGRLGSVGTGFASVGAVVLLGVFIYGLIAATGSSLGPTYVLASLATIIGVVLFAAGSWRAKLLPRWLVVAWPIAWAVGSMLPILGPGPLLLAATYIAMAIVLPRRV